MSQLRRCFLFIFLFTGFCFQTIKSQEIVFTKFYDSTWSIIKQDSAFYLCDYQKKDNLYLCQCYWNSSNKLKSISMKQKMALYSKTFGLQMMYFENGSVESSSLFDEDGIQINTYKYYENGQLEDSIFYNEKGKIDSAFHYYSDGKLKALYFPNAKNKKDSLLIYNSKGEKLDNLTYIVEAHYKTGDKDWLNYVKQHLNPNVAADNRAPEGEYTVIVRFTVEKDGSISKIKPQTKFGYGMEEAVVKMIESSPKWNPQVFLGEIKSVDKYQPVTFVVSE